MSVKPVATTREFQELLTQKSHEKLVVVEFYATWCTACTAIVPFMEQLARKYSDTHFAKIDVEQLKSVATACKITGMPTFHFYKGGKKVAEVKGANAREVERNVELHHTTVSGEAPGSSSGSRNNFGIAGHIDLTDHVTPNQIDALNQKEEHNVRNIFKSDDSYIESDVDEQLIITVPFNQPVKIHSIKLKANNLNQAPKTIKIYANRQNIGFDEADSIQETQTIELQESDYEENAVINLRFVKFQNVNQLVLFVVDNLGDEETTQLQQLIFIGSPIEATNMSNLKKNDEE
ncbi:hypothetical protein VTP01DRAFT_10235 [Rhizomucor pusillus]|uniref:uncharacterized protein n=1 Tax=Rhizomucor pusillus TaxID=4840 RepID=UPI00374375F4